MMNKQSFGGGYGINRKVGGASALTTAEPAMKGVTVKPGCGKQMQGGTKMKHFQGAKIFRGKA
jgi:hypothetical protein